MLRLGLLALSVLGSHALEDLSLRNTPDQASAETIGNLDGTAATFREASGVAEPSDSLAHASRTESRPASVEEIEEFYRHQQSFTQRVHNASVPEVSEPFDLDRRLQGCTSFEDNPRDPGNNVAVVAEPWFNVNQRVCKLFVQYADQSNFVCSASLVGPNFISTARHCTYNGCRGSATRVEVACGYGYWSGADDFDHYGTAFALSCLRFPEYDASTTCVNGISGGGDLNFDIQLCELDRKVGVTRGWLGMSSASLPSVTVRGYPGNSDLNAFIAFATDKQLTRTESISAVNTGFFTVDDMWAWGGESGCPYASPENRVHAVHRGGPTGCTEFGTRMRANLISEGLVQWPVGPDYCQVIEARADINNFWGGQIRGVGLGNPIFPSISQTEGDLFNARVTLHNVGNLPVTITLDWYASTNDFISTFDYFLARVTLTIQGNQFFRWTLSNLRVEWPFDGVAYIGVLWNGPGCFTNNGVTSIAGRVFKLPTPAPTLAPSLGPSSFPSAEPSSNPSPAPYLNPTPVPTPSPDASGTPSYYPTAAPLAEPTMQPTPQPTPQPVSDPPNSDPPATPPPTPSPSTTPPPTPEPATPPPTPEPATPPPTPSPSTTDPPTPEPATPPPTPEPATPPPTPSPSTTDPPTPAPSTTDPPTPAPATTDPPTPAPATPPTPEPVTPPPGTPPPSFEPCASGKLSSSGAVCCDASCNKCGGCNCANDSGGAEGCCPKMIAEDGIYCASPTQTRCLVSEYIPEDNGLYTCDADMD